MLGQRFWGETTGNPCSPVAALAAIRRNPPLVAMAPVVAMAARISRPQRLAGHLRVALVADPLWPPVSSRPSLHLPSADPRMRLPELDFRISRQSAPIQPPHPWVHLLLLRFHVPAVAICPAARI